MKEDVQDRFIEKLREKCRSFRWYLGDGMIKGRGKSDVTVDPLFLFGKKDLEDCGVDEVDYEEILAALDDQLWTGCSYQLRLAILDAVGLKPEKVVSAPIIRREWDI